MHRTIPVAVGVMVLGLAGTTDPAQAQYRSRRWHYPGGYGAYGWGGWGNYANDPGADYMRGLGSYARGIGAYELQDARAQAINVETVQKWNKALRERQAALRREQQQAQAQQNAERRGRVRDLEIEDGSTLNALLDQLLSSSLSAVRPSASKVPLSGEVIRDIPFESETEALTICLDQMTADDAWPPTLQDDRFAPERRAIRDAVRKALEEDAKGQVSRPTVKQINEAVARLRAKFTKSNGGFDLIYADADEFTKSLAGLSGMLTNTRLKPILTELENYKDGSLADLIGFMQAFNLRFGPATSDRQKRIYRELVPQFERVVAETRDRRNVADTPTEPAGADDQSGKSLQGAARQVFKGMSWKHLNAQDQAAPPE